MNSVSNMVCLLFGRIAPNFMPDRSTAAGSGTKEVLRCMRLMIIARESGKGRDWELRVRACSGVGEFKIG